MSRTTAKANLRRRHVTLAQALAGLRGPENKTFSEVLAHGSLSIEIYAPRGVDPQTPHRRDELYVVVSGRGEFVNGPDRHPFQPGDVLFVPAGVVHRFESFNDDFVTWVVFFGPDGGEADPPA